MYAKGRHAPATLRNREPILAVLSRILPVKGLVLEIASGTGEHAAWFGENLPHLIIQPSDVDPEARASIDAHVERCSNVQRAIELDAARHPWPLTHADAIVCINMIHIAPWESCEGLM